MNVLVVDDQYDVVQGVLTGVDWQKLDITDVFHAYSADEARRLLREKEIHILLCDIEMPRENGLELYKRVKEDYPGLQCIFLSAHSEFEYAKEAIQLGSFDYIVQPASYEDVHASIKRAVLQIQANTKRQELYEYGAYWRGNEQFLLENYIRGFLLNAGHSYRQLQRDLNNLNIRFSAQTLFRSVLIQFTKPSEQEDKDVLKREVVQLMEPYRLKVLIAQLDDMNYLAILYTEGSFDAPVESLLKQLIVRIQTKRSCSIVCYLSDIGLADMLKQQYRTLCQMRQHNVALYSKVFARQNMNHHKEGSHGGPDMQEWVMLIANGGSRKVRNEIHNYLARQKQIGVVHAEFLARFHQDFIQLFLTIAKQMKLDASEVFFARYPYSEYIQAYTSLDKMLDLVNFVMDYVEEHASDVNHVPDPIERAIAYIDQNIEKSCSRAEIAEAIYINPEYLSRLFKKVKGISLNDYITMKKTEIAKSLLRNTNIPVNLIASKVGYSNFSYFSQVFKKYCGFAPLEYRQRKGS
ncbi:response regulator [Paenibacillus sp.]|uniref:response regulator n=1 Tax=Paenibacillus sp. TaxID=58172 RepID=UPI002810E0A7|nr:response regulator [Paenibacillus sp.]